MLAFEILAPGFPVLTALLHLGAQLGLALFLGEGRLGIGKVIRGIVVEMAVPREAREGEGFARGLDDVGQEFDVAEAADRAASPGEGGRGGSAA